MKENKVSRIVLVMLFTITLFSINYAYAMFNERGEWICSQEIDIEISYYESYTRTFQNAIDKIHSTDDNKAAQSYFEFAIEREVIGQDWERSQNCLIKLGIDVTELSPIVVPGEKISIPLKPTIDDRDSSDPIREMISAEEYVKPEPIDNLHYIGVGIILIIIIVGGVVFLFKSRKKFIDSKDYENNNEERDEHHVNIEIEIKGGIEK